MTKTTLTFEEIDALMAIVEMTNVISMTEITGQDINALFDKLCEMRDEV